MERLQSYTYKLYDFFMIQTNILEHFLTYAYFILNRLIAIGQLLGLLPIHSDTHKPIHNRLTDCVVGISFTQKYLVFQIYISNSAFYNLIFFIQTALAEWLYKS